MSDAHHRIQDSLAAIEQAAEKLEGVITPTDLIFSDYFSSEYANRIWLKPENLQKTGSFKIRGAFNKIAQLSEAERARGIVTASAGNHAQGVAYAAQHFGCPCTIVMPQVTPLIKVESAREKNAEVVIHGAQYDDAYQKALDLAAERGATFVHAYDDKDVIAGQGTIGLEILADLEDVDEIYVPVGGGGLISGVALAAKALKPDIRIVGVEPEGAASMSYSLAEGRVTPLATCHTCAEGVAVRQVGDQTFAYAQDLVDAIITVPEADIMEAVLMLLERHKIVAEASGAITIAALKKATSYRRNIVCVISGGNIDMVTISSMINSGLVSRGRIFAFTVELPDSPGQLLSVAQTLADVGANVIGLEHNQFKATDRYSKVQLEVTAETNGHAHIERVLQALRDRGYDPIRSY